MITCLSSLLALNIHPGHTYSNPAFHHKLHSLPFTLISPHAAPTAPQQTRLTLPPLLLKRDPSTKQDGPTLLNVNGNCKRWMRGTVVDVGEVWWSKGKQKFALLRESVCFLHFEFPSLEQFVPLRRPGEEYKWVKRALATDNVS